MARAATPLYPRHIAPIECSVCGRPARRELTRTHFEETYRFCSPECVALFDEAPTRYLA